MERYGIPYHERDHGQLFCDRSAKDILNMLLTECDRGDVEIRTRTPIKEVRVGPPHQVDTPTGTVQADALVIATGGYSIPSMGATGARALKGLSCGSPRAAGASCEPGDESFSRT